MASGGGSPPTPSRTTGGPLVHREARWRGQGYADITKLREIAAKHDRLCSRYQQRAARINTKIEKLRHQGTVLREKAQSVLARVPEIEQEIAQHERDIKASLDRTGGIQVGSDVTSLQYRIRKLQQKVVDLQHKARSLELKAAQRTQKSAELKVKVDQNLEHSKLEEAEAKSYRERADRLQLATEGEVAARLGAPTSDPSNDSSNPPVQPT